VNCSIHVTKAGRESIIRSKKVISKKDLSCVYNSTKAFANQVINFGIPAGNKSSKNALNNKILTYSERTLACFLRGVFDGDGSIRQKPFEATITTGLKKNAEIFQQALLRLDIVSSIKPSTNSSISSSV